jgi:hypothetical protein
LCGSLEVLTAREMQAKESQNGRAGILQRNHGTTHA